MDYKNALQLTQSIITTVRNTAVASVKELERFLRNHTFSVKVVNPQEKVTVQGKVDVDQSATNKALKDVALSIRELKKPLTPHKEIKVTNFPKFPKFPAFPKSFQVTNFPKSTAISNLDEVLTVLGKINKSVNDIDVKPSVIITPTPITVEAPVVNVPKTPAPVVNVEKPDLSEITRVVEFLTALGPSNPLPVRLSDGKKFYKALERMAEIYAGSSFSAFQNGSGENARAMLNRNAELKVTTTDTWSLNDVDNPTNNLTYLGEETVDGKWRITQVTTVGNRNIMKYATIRNNPSASTYDYPDAWDNHESFSYGRVSEAL